MAWKRRRTPRHELEADGDGLAHRLRGRCRRGPDRSAEVRTLSPERVDLGPDRVGDDDLGGLSRQLGLGADAPGRGGARGDLYEEGRDAADDAVGDGAVVQVLGGGARVQRDRRVLQRLGAESLDERAGRENERVAGLDALSPHIRQHVRHAAERRGLARRRPMHEVGELARLVAGQEEPRAPDKEDLRFADPRGIELVVHDDGAGAVEDEPAALVPETLRGAAVRLAEGLAQRNLDARGEVVVVLLLREIGDLASDIRARVRALLPCDLAKEVETALRAERRPKRRLAREDDVGRIRTELGGRAQLRDEARLAHRGRV